MQGVEKITLIFGEVVRFVQLDRRTVDAPCVMTGGEVVAAETTYVFQTDAELDLSITGDIGIRRATRAIFGEELLEDERAILSSKIDAV
jgi:hypothetical protein